MRNFLRLVALVLTGASLSPAMAQESDLRMNPGPQADFSGVGIGIDAGFGIGSTGNINTSGPIGGGHIGYNFQASRLVGGAEADFLTSGIKSGSLPTLSIQQNFLSSARVKAGWIFGDLLAYGTLGWGYSTTSLRDFTGTSNKSVTGNTLGAGVEFSVTRNVSIRAEYMRYNFGTQTYVTPLNTVPLSSNTNLLRAGASVHF